MNEDAEVDAAESETESYDAELTRLREEGTAHLFKYSRAEFLRLKPRMAYYKEFKNFPGEVKSHFSHEKNNLRRLLSYRRKNLDGTTREWTADDLDNSAVLERALELTLRVRLGADNISMLPSPQISFTRVSEQKIRHLTKLLGQAELTAQEIDEMIERSAARARRGGSRSELRGVEDGMTLNEIDEIFRADITRGETAQSRKRKRQQSQGDQVAQEAQVAEAADAAQATDAADADDATGATGAANGESSNAPQPNELEYDENFWLPSDAEEVDDSSSSEDDDSEDDGDRIPDGSGAEESADQRTVT